MSLQEKLDALNAKARERIPPESRAIMERAIDDLRRLGIVARVPKIGDPAPDFTLPNSQGEPVGLAGLLARGSAVLSFYRGRW